MTILIRRDPPPIKAGRRRDHASTEWNAILVKAIKNPGKWFLVQPSYETTTSAASAAYDFRTRRIATIPEGRWDAVSRECDLYVMFLGD